MVPRSVDNPLELDRPGSPVYIYVRGDADASTSRADALLQEAWRTRDQAV